MTGPSRGRKVSVILVPKGYNLCRRGQAALTGERKACRMATANDESSKVLPRIENKTARCVNTRTKLIKEDVR